MSSGPDEDRKLRIDILLKEYDTLRTEILQRGNLRVGAIGLFVAIGILFFGESDGAFLWRVVAALLVLGAAGVIWIESWYGVGLCAFRLREVENRVNELAGEELLVWESTWASRRLFNRFSRFVAGAPTGRSREPDVRSHGEAE